MGYFSWPKSTSTSDDADQIGNECVTCIWKNQLNAIKPLCIKYEGIINDLDINYVVTWPGEQENYRPDCYNFIFDFTTFSGLICFIFQVLKVTSCKIVHARTCWYQCFEGKSGYDHFEHMADKLRAFYAGNSLITWTKPMNSSYSISSEILKPICKIHEIL